MSVQEDLERKIELAETILNRLDSQEPLSSILSQVRRLMSLIPDPVFVALTDILIHGITHVPYQSIPFKDEHYLAAGLRAMRLCSIEDISKLTVEEVIKRFNQANRLPIENQMVTVSVYEMENLQPIQEPNIIDTQETLDLKIRHTRYFNRSKQILTTLRAIIYDKVGSLLNESITEQERVKLFGPDYRIVTDRLNCLGTAVGNELLAAIDALNSTNPASWNSCALVCRNVILKLAHILWKVDEKTFVTQSGRRLDISYDKEKNILFAYIDFHSRTASPEVKAMLDQANRLIGRVYNKGSEGKRQVNHNDAQELLVDTFNLVDLLNKATELQPIFAFTSHPIEQSK